MRRLVPVLVLVLALAACSGVPPVDLPDLVDTTNGITGIHVGGTAAGPALLRAVSAPDVFADELYLDVYGYATGGPRPAWLPEATVAYWALSCEDGVLEAILLDRELTDAWDLTEVYVAGDFQESLGFVDGTLREFDDGTLVLSCEASARPSGLVTTRHLVVPGGATGGRFVVEVIEFAATEPGGVDLGTVTYRLNDGADDDLTEPWATYGTTAPFQWATKDDYDTTDPAIGAVPLVSTAFDVDDANTAGDDYVLAGSGTLAQGERTAVAFVVGIRGGFARNDVPGKDAAMQALGVELAALDGGALCASPRPEFYVWSELLQDGGALVDELCAGWDLFD